MPSFRNVRPCTFLGYEFVGKLASVWNHGHPRPRMYIRVHLWATSLQANSLLLNFTDIPVRSEKPFTVSFFANRQDRYEARAKINRRRIYDTLRINLCAATK